MKKCSDCNVEMIDNCTISGHQPLKVGMEGKTNIFVQVPTGEVGDFLGISLDMSSNVQFKARICPKCGKMELYINPNELPKN